MKNEELYALKDVITSLAIALEDHDLGSAENKKKATAVIAKALDRLETSI